MTTLQKKYNISNQRAIELINLFCSIKNLTFEILTPAGIIEKMGLTEENEKACIKELISNYLKIN